MKIGFFVVLCWESKIINYNKKVLLNSKKKKNSLQWILPLMTAETDLAMLLHSENSL
jgi:hypothetical protein